VPDDVTIKCLQAEVDNPDSAGFLFDGFPRTFAAALDVLLQKKSITATIALEADDEILVARLLDRGKTSGRADDQDVRKKLEIVTKNTMKQPLMGIIKKGKFHAVNGIGSIDEIHQFKCSH
jgi:adenylate kinase